MNTYDKQYIRDLCIALESYICRSYSIGNYILSRTFDYINDDHKYADILPEFNRNNIKKICQSI